MRKIHRPNPELYKAYYQKQINGQYGGTLPAFHGIKIQRGYGIGSFLKGLFRSAVPLFKTGAKTVGKAALTSGMNVARDFMSGQDIKSAVKSRAMEAANELRSKAVRKANSVMGQTGKGIKRRAPVKICSSSLTKKRKTSSKKKAKGKEKRTSRSNRKKPSKDIFGN